jgi:hypothetical protein
MTSLIPSPVLQFSDGDGKPFAGGSIAVYEPGTFTPLSTYVDSGGTVPNANPVVLDADGRCVMYGHGRLRLILFDAAENLIWDGETAAYLNEDVISPVMLPVVGAATLAEARRLLGVDDAIQTAVDNIELMPGPAGPTGVAGPQGPQGVPGATGGTGGGSSSEISKGNPGWFFMPDTGFLMQFGNDSTDGGGSKTVPFSRGFTSLISVTAVTVDNPVNLVLRCANMTPNWFTVFIEDTDNHGGVGSKFNWMAVGYV